MKAFEWKDFRFVVSSSGEIKVYHTPPGMKPSLVNENLLDPLERNAYLEAKAQADKILKGES